MIDINDQKYFTGIIAPDFRSNFLITHIRDGDSFRGIWDRGANRFDGSYDTSHEGKVDCRQYGINSQEITRSASKGRGDKEVAQGFDHRDAFMRFIGLDPAQFPRKVQWTPIPWTPVIIETIRDETGKYGRLKTITHYKGYNVNEAMRDIIGGVEFYDNKSYPSDYPIRA